MSAKKSNDIFVKIEVKEEAIQEIFDCVVRNLNTIGYWTEDLIEFYSKDKKSFTHLMIKVSEGGEWKYLTRKGIICAYEKAIAEEWLSVKDLDPFEIDMTVADVITQYALFGEVVYS